MPHFVKFSSGLWVLSHFGPQSWIPYFLILDTSLPLSGVFHKEWPDDRQARGSSPKRRVFPQHQYGKFGWACESWPATIDWLVHELHCNMHLSILYYLYWCRVTYMGGKLHFLFIVPLHNSEFDLHKWQEKTKRKKNTALH